MNAEHQRLKRKASVERAFAKPDSIAKSGSIQPYVSQFPLVRLQRNLGNQTLERLYRYGVIRSELEISQSGGVNGVIQRYGHANSCKDDEHLKPFIWPGHDHGKKALDRAVYETGRDPLHAEAASHLKVFFGQKGAEKTNLKTIHENFVRIRNALDEQYLYHCASSCGGENGKTSEKGNKDITICFDRMKNSSIPQAAWLIIHENVHRGLNVWPNPHPWYPKNKLSGCVLNEGVLSARDLVLDNPDSYACFASIMWATKTE